MLRVTVYLKSGAVAEFDAAAIDESGESHPKFRLGFRAPAPGARHLVYLDRDDVSAVVVEDRTGEAANASGSAFAAESTPVAVPDTIRQEVQEVLAIATAGAAGSAHEGEPSTPTTPPRRRRR